MKKVFLHANPMLENLKEMAKPWARAFERMGFTLAINDELEKRLDGGVFERTRFIPREQGVEQCDFIAVIGGDGTILRQAIIAAQKSKPVLGINCGTIGFMSELEHHETSFLAGIRDGRFYLDYRMMLDVEVRSGEGVTKFSSMALNDAVLTTGILSRTIKMAVEVNGQPTISFSGDGVIVCSPTGSTAYSLSAGGPILEPSCECIAVTPICPHAINIRSFVVSARREVRLTPPRQSAEIYLSVDGYQSVALEPDDSVYITRSPRTFSLIRLKGIGFYDIINKKLLKGGGG